MEKIMKMFGSVKPEELMIKAMEMVLSPSQKAMMSVIPAMVNQTLDMSRKPIPKIMFNQKGKIAAIFYEFETEQEAAEFISIEEKTLGMVKDFKADIDRQKKQQEQKALLAAAVKVRTLGNDKQEEPQEKQAGGETNAK